MRRIIGIMIVFGCILTYSVPTLSQDIQENCCMLLGDADQSGNIDLDDARAILAIALHIHSVDERTIEYLDVDDDDWITLSDALYVLECALKIKPEQHYIPLEYELLYEGLQENGMEGFYEFEFSNEVEACEKLLQYGMGKQADLLLDLSADQIEGKKLCLSATKVYAEKEDEVTVKAVGYKESTDNIQLYMEESPHTADAKTQSYIRLFMVDESLEIKGQKEYSQVYSDRWLIQWEGRLDVSGTAVFSTKDALNTFLLEQLDEKNDRLQLFTKIEEMSSGENCVFLVANAEVQNSGEIAINLLDVKDEDGVLCVDVNNTTREILEPPNWEKRTSECFYVIGLPKDMAEGKRLDVQVHVGSMYGYEKVDNIQMLAMEVQDDGRHPDMGQLVHVLDYVPEGEFDVRWSMGNLASLNLSDANRKILYNALEDFDFSQYQLLVMVFEPFYIREHEGNDFQGTLYCQDYDGRIRLAFCYGEGEIFKRTDPRQAYLFLVPVKRMEHGTLRYPKDVELHHVYDGECWFDWLYQSQE